MLREQIIEYLGQDWIQFQSRYREKLKSPILILEEINEYLLANGGKQIRPMLTILIAKALRDFCNSFVIDTAVAVEMLHTATLLHDDVADDSPLRRGAPTIMALYGATPSVLVGDFWLSKAVEMIIDHPDKRVLRHFSKCLSDLAEGEMIQQEKANLLNTTEEDYRGIIYRKTASLFETAAICGACSVSASEEEIQAVTGYARHMGIAFQMMDDIFDYSPELSLGKPVGLDIKEKKITIPLIGMMKNAPDDVVSDFLEKMRKTPETLSEEAVSLVQRHGGFEYAKKCLNLEILNAKKSLEGIRKNKATEYLLYLADYMSIRRS